MRTKVKPAIIAKNKFHELAPSVFYADLLSKDQCDDILDEYSDEIDWKEAYVTTYVQEDNGEHHLKSILDRDKRVAKRIHFKDIDMTSRHATDHYMQVVNTEVKDLIYAEFGLATDEFGDAEIVNYPTGGVFTPHRDSNIVKPYRAISVLLYLNDDFEGGYTSFPDLNCHCVPKTGRVLLFPSQLLHSGEPIIRGEKNIIVLWAFYPGGR